MRKKGRKVRYTPVEPDSTAALPDIETEDEALPSVELGDLSNSPAAPKHSTSVKQAEENSDEAYSPEPENLFSPAENVSDTSVQQEVRLE